MVEGGVTSRGEIVEDVALLSAQRVTHGKHPFDEAASVGAVGAEAGKAPQDSMPKAALGRVVRGLDVAVLAHEGPQGRLDGEQIAAGCGRLGVGELLPIPEFETNPEAQMATDVNLEARQLQGAIADSMPPGKQLRRILQQFLTDTGRLAAARHEVLKGAPQMGPTHLAAGRR